MKRAETLEEARKLLDPRPLDFTRPNPEGADAASDPGYYMEVPERFGDGFRLPGPIENIRQRLVTSGPDVKVFLSGHVGSGKSTELSRLAVGDEITRRFHVVTLRLKDAMLRESVGLYAPDYDALLHAHRTNALRAAEDRRYLDLSRVLECYNDAVWFEVNPLLWPLLGRHSGA